MRSTIIGVAEAARLSATSACCIFDCSFDLDEPEAGQTLYSMAHLPGARYLHLDDDLAGERTGSNGRHPLPEPQAFAKRLRDEGLNKSDLVIAYDNASGPYGARLWWLLRWLGHEKVVVMDGNVTEWQAQGNPVERGAPAIVGLGDFEPGVVRHASVASAGDVLRNLAAGLALVVDARSALRFRGEVLVMDKVAGHIPGARNRPFADNLNADGHFKPASILRDEFGQAISGFSPDNVILQCGSGVTACHNALAMEHAGLRGARLYAGSWSEWSSDPLRPVEFGAERREA